MFKIAMPRLEVRREIVIRRAPRSRRDRTARAALRIPVPGRIPIPPLPRQLPLRMPAPIAIPVPVRAPAPVPVRRPVPRWLLIVAGIVAGVVILRLVTGRRRAQAPVDELETPAAEDAAPPVAPAGLRRFMTTRCNPAIERLGLVGGRRSPCGYLEHVGRVSGTVRRTPVMPEIAAGHAYVPLPFGVDVDWVRNVRAAGHCRLQVHGMVYDLDEPAVVTAREHEGLSERSRRRSTARGDRYLRLKVLSETPGDLGSAPALQPAEPEAAPGEVTAGA